MQDLGFSMPSVSLPDRAVLRVAGPDAEAFLQNIVTADLSDLPPDAAKPSALLTPQGKILFDFLIARDGPDAFLLDVRRDIIDDFARRLMMYRLRAKAEIAKQEQMLVSASWEADSISSATDSSASHIDSSGAFRDLRFAPRAVYRRYAEPTQSSAGLDDWNRLRIAEGVAESGADYALSDAFPHDVLLDQNGGVGFKKGCYVGQEVVSRMQHRGTARRRVMIVRSDTELPASGTDVTANGRSIGALGTVVGNQGLAIVRIDRVKDAMDASVPILAGDAVLDLSIPSNARFTFPADTVAETN
jgi:folate-binding protein YgfZ